MRLARNALLQLFLCAILAACVGPRANLEENPKDFAAPSRSVATQEMAADYQFAPFDRIKVTVYRVPDLSNEYRVEPSGIVSFPLIGTMKVTGLTTAQLSQSLSQSYGERYLVHPNVSVQLIEATGNEVTVEGSVRTPSVISVFGETNLLQAVAKAGGLSDQANSKRVLVFRKIDGEQKVALFNLSEVRAGVADNPAIYGGDIVVVEGSAMKAIYQPLLSTIQAVATFVAVVRP